MDFLAIGVAILLFLMALVVPLLLTMFFHRPAERKVLVVEVPIGYQQEGAQVLRSNGQEGARLTNREKKGQNSRAIQVPISGSGLRNNTVYTFGQPGQLIKIKQNYRKRR